MSESCEALNSSMVHTVATAGSEFYFHLPTTPCDQDSDEQDSNEQDFGDQPNNGPAENTSECARYFAVKSTVDRVIAGILMVFALPIMLLVGVAILLFDGRPVFFRQRRVGKNGSTFWIWKFRTMCRNAEKATGAVWSSTSDPRITALGRWLRCTHLDELPQFFNVLAGDMNLIGPRPERPEFVRELVLELPHYRERLHVRPGITGLAQLHLGYDQSLADVRRKVSLDLEYIRTVSLLQDVRILLFTLPYIAGRLLESWKTNPRTLDDAKKVCTDCSSQYNVPERVRHTHEASSAELKPQVACLPIISIGARGTTPAAPSLGAATMNGVVRAQDVCQQLVRDEYQVGLKACGKAKHVG